VNYFVSHRWAYPFNRTVDTLSKFAKGVYERIGKIVLMMLYFEFFYLA